MISKLFDQLLIFRHLFLPPKLVTIPQEVTETLQTFGVEGSRPVIGFCPGAEFGPAKRWPHYHYASLAQTLISQKGYQVLLFGSKRPRSG